MKFARAILESAHDHAVNNKNEITESKTCGCFYCITMFAPDKITKWLPKEPTAVCPNCGIDAVIGDKSGYPVGTKEFLQAMHMRWFD